MRPISPAPSNKLGGFTFIEVLAALVIAALLVGATCSALLTTLRAEQLAGHLRTAGLMSQQIIAECYRGQAPTQLMKQAEAEWTLASNTVFQTVEESNQAWQVWTLSPRDRPSLSIQISLRSAGP